MPPQTFLQSSTNVAVLIFRTAVPTAVLIRIEFEVEMLPEVFVPKSSNLQYSLGVGIIRAPKYITWALKNIDHKVKKI